MTFKKYVADMKGRKLNSFSGKVVFSEGGSNGEGLTSKLYFVVRKGLLGTHRVAVNVANPVGNVEVGNYVRVYHRGSTDSGSVDCGTFELYNSLTRKTRYCWKGKEFKFIRGFD